MNGVPTDEPWLGDPALAPLLSVLTAGPAPGELAGLDDALAMFRATTSTAHAAAERRRLTRQRVRLATLASMAAMVVGFAAAGYAAVLPASLQSAASRYLGFAGFPAASHRAPTSGGVPGGGGQPSGSGASRTNAGSAGPSASPAPDKPAPGSSAHPGLPVQLRVLAGTRGKPNVLSVSCPSAKPGDVVQLQVWSGPPWHQANPPNGTWHTVRSGRIGRAGLVSFNVTARDLGSAYRVVLQATSAHGRSVSGVVVIDSQRNPHPRHSRHTRKP